MRSILRSFTLVASLAVLCAQHVGATKAWVGSNLYYAAGLTTAQQDTLLSNLASAEVKVLRVWLDGQSSDQKGTKLNPYPSLEPNSIGTFDDTVLNRLDDFMAKAASYGIKLMISMHSFNALSGGDVYGKKYTTEGFYTSSDALANFKKRLAWVMAHVNPHNGKTWAKSPEYIFAFEAQNEAMNSLGQDFIKAHAKWQCDVASAIRSNLQGSTDILVTTGGEGWLDVSMQDAFFSCAALDVVAIHAYGTSDFDTSRIAAYVSKAKSAGKKLIMQEWGACYYTTANNRCDPSSILSQSARASNIRTWADQIAAAGVPWMYWQILPNNDPHSDWDYEIGVTESIWADFKDVAVNTKKYDSAFDFTKWLP